MNTREEIIKKAQELLACGALSKDACDAIKADFPELSESEDERTRKELMNFVAKVKDIAKSGRDSWAVRKEDVEMCERFLAYLEKQKEQKGSLRVIKDASEWEKIKEQKPAEWSEEDDFMATIVENSFRLHCSQMTDRLSEQYKKFFEKVKSLRPQPHWKPSEEQPEVALDKLVNEEFACHSRTTEYGLEATYNRAELYQLIKRMAFLFNARKEDKI